MNEEVKSKESRKASKPIMEKKRRARINESLNELKTLILEAMRKDNSCYSKLEKADILEMTVQHLKNLKNQQVSDFPQSNQVSLANYRAGFNQCASEITRLLTGLGNTDSALRTRLLEHLATRCLVTKPVEAAETRGHLPQTPCTNPLILPKPPPANSLPLVSPLAGAPKLLPASTHYQLAPYPLSSNKVAVLLPTANPFFMESSSAAPQPSLFPVFSSKDPTETTSRGGLLPIGLDSRPYFCKSFS
ncbi:Transcription factor HES-1-A [Acropora cervicornis]|uniref:Transcription factor HES-1-A n=1 Tax=Acropora cervicornis TaxID=6130 RepID=A0AAD9V9W0_ACRCE|nr:Transcription factor HES-1-A [Acropora cervicornis]